MKTIWKILIAVLVLVGIVLLWRGVSKAPDVGIAPQADLPEAVGAKRQAIYDAAMMRDYSALAALASEDISYTFGGPYEGGFEAYLRAQEERGEDVLTKIATILNEPYRYQSPIYAWPRIFGKQASEWTEEDMSELRAVATEEEIEAYRLYGAYTGHRIGIREDGTWMFFVAGD